MVGFFVTTEMSSDRSRPELKKQHTLLYTPYSPLADISSTDGSPQIAHIEQYVREKRWSPAHNASLNLIQQSLDGLHYLQTYDRFLIKAIVTAAYSGWVAFASLYILRPVDNIPTSYFATSSLASYGQNLQWSCPVGFLGIIRCAKISVHVLCVHRISLLFLATIFGSSYPSCRIQGSG
jgi:hypothetical protein